MKASTFISSLALVSSVLAGPIKKRAITDADILNYALTLEHLEDTFYRTGLNMFSESDFTDAGYSARFYKNLKEVSYDETTHVSFLTSALTAAGATPVAACTYDFGITSVETFLATAAVLEGVGVSAYLGAAASISNKDYLTAAGSILTVEARHTAYLRAAGLKESPFPQAFDVPLDFDEVYSLAAPFITACPATNPALPVKAFPTLTVTTDGKVYTGSEISISYDSTWTGDVYASFVTVTGPVWADISGGSDKGCTVTVPAGVHGQSYLVITSSDSVSDDTVVAGPAIVEISGTDGSP